MIVKVRRPMNDTELPWLVCDKGHKHPRLFHPCAQLRASFGLDLKRYYEAEYVAGNWVLRVRVADQNW